MYKLDDVKIVPNGINLTAPGDALPDGDVVDLTGFWAGSVGRLQQAPGYTRLSAVHFNRFFDGICQTSGRTYYSGRDAGGSTGELYQVGRGGGGEAAIDSGYDGYPIGLLGFQGYLWSMNRAKQRRDDGTSVTDWTPAPPDAGALGITPGSVAITGLAIAEADPASKNGDGTYAGINLYTSASVDSMVVGGLATISGQGGTSAPMNGTWYVAAIFPGSPNNLIQLTASPALPDTTTFSTATGTFDYANPGMPLGDYRYWVTWVYKDLGESNPSSTGGVITPGLADSGGSPSLTITAQGQKITLDISALSPPAGTIGWNIYRQGPGMPSPYRLNENTLDLTRTSVDDFGDAAHVHDTDYLINGLGILMEGDHDAAPAARVLANNVYNGRILAANSADYPNRVWYTPALQPGFFRGSGNPQAGDWADIGTDRGDEVLFMSVKVGYVIVYRRKSIWRILGDFSDPNARIDPIVPDVGIVGPRAVACSSTGDYLRTPEGISKFNGDWAQKISPKLDPLFLPGSTLENFLAETSGQSQNCALGLRAGRLWVSFTAGPGNSFNTTSMILDTVNNRWFPSSYGIGAFLDIGAVFIGGSTTAVNNLETGYSDNGNPSVIAFQSGYEDCGQPDHIKTWADLIINHNTGGQTLHLRARTNKSATAADVFTLDVTLNSSALTKTIVPLVYPAAYSGLDTNGHSLAGKPISSFNLSIRIDGVGGLSGPTVIDTPLLLHYYLEARLAYLYDTDETDHGMPGVVKSVDMVEFDIDAPDGGALQVFSDLPGGAMAARLATGKPIAVTTGRGTVRVVFDAPIEGKLLRYVGTTTGKGMRVYGFRARITPIGVYVDGSISEKWDTRPIAIAA